MIRLLGANDVEVFRTIRLEALRCSPQAYSSTLEQWKALSLDEWQRRTADNPVFVAFRDHEPVGIMGYMQERSPKSAHRATIVMVYLRENLRGSGVAALLIQWLTEHARGQGIRQLELAVSADNIAAFRFYQREGFLEIGRVPGALVEAAGEVDEILMARRIDS